MRTPSGLGFGARKRWAAALPRGQVAALAATLIWGTNGPLTKVLIAEMGLLSIGAARSLAAAVLLFAAVWWRYGRQGFVLPPRDFARVVGLTVVGMVICQLAWLHALARIPVSVAVIISNISPIFIAFMAALWLGEPLRRRAFAGLAVSFSGIILLVNRGAGPVGPVDPVGAGFAVLCAFLWALYTVGGRSLLARYDALRIVGLNAVVSACCWVPLALLLEAPASRAVPLWVWFGTLYLGVMPVAVGGVLWYEAVRRLPAVQAGAFGYLVPVWSVIAAVLWLGEPLTPALIGSMLLIFAGMRLTQRR